MKSLRFGQKVRIVSQDGHPLRDKLIGQTGRVVRCRMADNGAWIKMDKPLDDQLACFPKDDDRHDHIIMYPDECELVK